MSKIRILAFLLAGVAALSFAGDGRWTTSGPYGNPGFVLFHPGDPNIVFSGLYRSTDRGLTWTPFKPPGSSEGPRIASKPPYDLFMVDANGPLFLYKSSDLGATWSRVSTTRLKVYGSSIGLSDFQISSSNPDVMYLSIVGAGVLRSGTGGKTWTVLKRDLPGPEHSSGILRISPTTSNVVYYMYSDFKTNATVLVKTLNGGQSWTSVGPALEYLHGMTLQVDPHNQDIVYAGTTVSQYKTVDGGRTWKRLTLPALTTTPNFWIDPRNSAIVWVTGSKSFKSTNGGNSWARTAWPRFNQPFMVAVDSRSTLTFAPAMDLLRSTDDGKTWKAANTGLRGRQAWMLDVNATRPGRILAPTGFSGIYRSADSGAAWSPFVRFNQTSINIVRSHPANGSVIGFTTADQFRISTNNGASWKTLEIRSFDFAFHPQNEETIYFLYGKITDGGETFHEYTLRPDGIGAQQVLADPSNGNTVYLKTNRSIYKSANAGSTWSKLPITTTDELQSLLIAPSNPNVLYAGSTDGLWVSVNAGASWVHYGKNSFGVIDPIAVDPANPQTLFAASYGFIIKLSTDGGKSFSDFDRTGLPSGIDILSGAFDSANPKTLHLATSDGIFSYTR